MILKRRALFLALRDIALLVQDDLPLAGALIWTMTRAVGEGSEEELIALVRPYLERPVEPLDVDRQLAALIREQRESDQAENGALLD